MSFKKYTLHDFSFFLTLKHTYIYYWLFFGFNAIQEKSIYSVKLAFIHFQ